MIKKIIYIIFLLITFYTIFYIDQGIKKYDLNFYFGKDNGYTSRIESIIILNSLFFILNGIFEKFKLLKIIFYGLFGCFISLLISILCYLIPLNDSGLIFHILSILLSFSSYFVFTKFYKNIVRRSSGVEIKDSKKNIFPKNNKSLVSSV